MEDKEPDGYFVSIHLSMLSLETRTPTTQMIEFEFVIA